MLKRILWYALPIMLVAGAVQAQTMPSSGDAYTVTTTNINLIDNKPNYTSHDLWYAMKGAPQLKQFVSGLNADGTYIFRGIDPAGNIWEYDESFDSKGAIVSSWAQHPEMGTNNNRISVGANVIWKTSNSLCWDNVNYILNKWSGTAWTRPFTACGVQVSVGDQDGKAVTLSSNGDVYYEGASSFIKVVSGAPMQSVAALSVSVFYANDLGGAIYQRDPAGTSAFVPSTYPRTPEALGRLITTGGGQLWFLSNTGKAYVYDYDNGVWTKPMASSTVTELSTSAPLHTFAIANNTLLRFEEFGYEWFVSLDGHYNCGPNGCPPNGTHTPHIDLDVQSGSLGGYHGYGVGGPPNATLHQTASVKSFDIWGCAYSGFDPGECLTQTQPTATVQCSIAGTIFSAFVGWPPMVPLMQVEACKGTYTKGAPQNCHADLFGYIVCDYAQSIPFCTAATTPPDAIALDGIHGPYFHNMLQNSQPYLFGFGACERLITPIGVPLTHWVMLMGGAISTSYGPGDCTKHP